MLALPAISVRSLDRLSGVSLLGDLAVLLLAGAGTGLWVAASRAGKAHPLHWLPSQEEVRGRGWVGGQTGMCTKGGGWGAGRQHARRGSMG